MDENFENFATFADATSPHNAEPWLLHGVTGSGKTEVYLRLIEKTLELKRSAILLVPEISLTPQSARRLTERFGTLVAIWHSALSAGEKYDTWRKLRMGEVRILLGSKISNSLELAGSGAYYSRRRTRQQLQTIKPQSSL